MEATTLADALRRQGPPGRFGDHAGVRQAPQGAVVSPILANVYLHDVLDLWFRKKWRARNAAGHGKGNAGGQANRVRWSWARRSALTIASRVG